MSNVVNLAAYRSRRQLQGVVDRHTEKELDGFIDVIEKEIRQLADLTDCTWLSVDEVHHWTQNNTAFEKLRRAYLNHIADRPERIHWSPATPERRAEADRALRILRGTDHGSDDGNAEGHHRDPGVPRG